jgi:hypothetical protein
MALLDYAITVFIYGIFGRVGGVMGVGEDGIMVGEEMRMAGIGEEGEEVAGYR